MFIHEGGNGGRHGVGHCGRHEAGPRFWGPVSVGWDLGGPVGSGVRAGGLFYNSWISMRMITIIWLFHIKKDCVERPSWADSCPHCAEDFLSKNSLAVHVLVGGARKDRPSDYLLFQYKLIHVCVLIYFSFLILVKF